MTDEPIIAEATGYAGGKHGPTLPLVQLAMAQAVAAAQALGIADDTPAHRVEQLTGVKGKCGADYILDAKQAARGGVLAEHRGLVNAHEGSKAAELHNARD